MIVNITNEIYTKLKTTLTDVTVLPSYPSTTPAFPCLIMEEISNNMHLDSIDSNGEHYNDISYEFNIYSNAENYLGEVRVIREAVDAIMNDLYGMNRLFSAKVPNYLDTTIYRYTLRYSGLVDSDKKVCRR